MSSYTLTVAAEEDLIRIYTEGVIAFGPEQASRYHQKLFQTFGFLADNPRAAAVRPELTKDIRIHSTGTHIVLYTVRRQDILILRIRHQHEDWLDHE